MVIKVAILAVFVGVVQILQSREAVTLINTFLNAASWYLLIKAQRKLRTDVTPKLAHVEEAVTAVAQQVSNAPPSAVEGGRRAYDPPHGSDC